jgi:hypothetical protein
MNSRVASVDIIIGRLEEYMILKLPIPGFFWDPIIILPTILSVLITLMKSIFES